VTAPTRRRTRLVLALVLVALTAELRAEEPPVTAAWTIRGTVRADPALVSDAERIAFDECVAEATNDRRASDGGWKERVAVERGGGFRIDVPAHVDLLWLDMEVAEGWCPPSSLLVERGDGDVVILLRPAETVSGRVDARRLPFTPDFEHASAEASWIRAGLDDRGSAGGRLSKDGTFEIWSVLRGAEVTVRIASAGEPPFLVRPVRTRAGDRDVVLVAEPGLDLRGTLTAPPRGGLPEPFRVTVCPGDWRCPFVPFASFATVESDGRFTVPALLPGPHSLAIFADRRTTLVAWDAAVDPLEGPVTLRAGFSDPLAMTVEVVGRPGERYRLTATLGLPRVLPVRRGTIPDSGAAPVSLSLPSGALSYTLHATSEPPGRSACARAGSGAPAHVRLTLEPEASVSGTLTGLGTERVIVFADVAGWLRAAPHVTRRGRFEIAGLPPGEARLTVYAFDPHPSPEHLAAPAPPYRAVAHHGPVRVGSADVVIPIPGR
jgi:hypothetical protein